MKKVQNIDEYKCLKQFKMSKLKEYNYTCIALLILFILYQKKKNLSFWQVND